MKKSKIKNQNDRLKLKILYFTLSFFILIFTFSISIPSAHAGLIVRIPSNLGISSGLVGYWTMDGADSTATTVLDKSGNGNTGTISGATKTIGKLGQALKFNGSTSYIQVADNNSLDIGGSMTVETWVAFTLSASLWPSAYYSLVSKDDPGGTGNENYLLYARGTNKNLAFLIRGLATNFVVFTNQTTWNAGQFYHVVGVYDGGYLRIYVNGSQDNSAVATGIPGITSYNVRIGNNNVGDSSLNGVIDDVRVYNRALGASEIKRLYNLGGGAKIAVTPMSGGLVGYWDFDRPGDIYTTTVGDRSGKNNHGTMTNMDPSTDWVDSKSGLGKALDFDGSNDYVTQTDTPSLSPTAAITVSGWIKTNTQQTARGVLTKGPVADNDYDYMLYFSQSDGVSTINFYIKNSAGTSDSLTVNYNYNDNIWHHYVGIFDGDFLMLYIDGVQIGSKDTALTNIRDSSSPFLIGAGWSSGYFNDLIDDVRVYNRALGASEIKRLYNMGAGALKIKTPTTSLTTGLVGYWTFDGSKISGTSALDSSGQNNTGTITGATKTIGKLGQALKFDGVDDFVNIPASDTEFLGAITISAWVKISLAGSSTIISKGASNCASNCPFDFNVVATTGKLYIVRAKAGLNYSDWMGSVTTSSNTWHHVAAVFTDNLIETKPTFYIDGVADTGATKTTNFSGAVTGSGAPIRIGLRDDLAGPTNGLIDDVRIYNRALSAAEVLRLYNMGR